MANRKKKEIGILVLLIVAVLVMTVGFALYTQTLTINGNLTVKGSPWNVHYELNNIVTTSGSVTPSPTPSLTNTDFSFTVTLEKPGDFYEATIQAYNEGTMDAYLKSVTMGGPTAAQQEYLSYTITYNNGTPYTGTTTGITGITLAAGAKHPVKVRVEYLEPANSSLLPASDQTITVTGSLYYESEANSATTTP